MKHFSLIFLLLNIYGCLFFGINAQEATLVVKTEKPMSQGLKDSLNLQKSYPDFETIQKKTDTIHLTLQRMGYVDVEFRDLKKVNDSSYQAMFFLGKKYRSIRIFYSEEDFSKREIQQIASNTKEGYFQVPFENMPKTMKKLVDIRNRQGSAFARVRLSEIEKNTDNELQATLLLDKGQTRTIDSVVVKGYGKFPKSFLKHYAGIKKGKKFDRKLLIRQNENLNSLGFASAKKIPEVLFRKDSTIVYFYLEKTNNNLFDGIIGFATNEETDKLELNGYLNLELNNNLNYGEQLTLNYKADGKEQLQFKVKAVLPYLFQSPFGLSGELNIFKRDSSFVTTEQQFRTTYQVNPASQVYIGYRGFDSSNLLDAAVAGIPIEDFKSKFFTVGAKYIKMQNQPLFPTKTFISLDLGAGKREIRSETASQYQAEAQLSHVFQLNKKNSILAQNITRALFSDFHLQNELYRFGGINSIRGFDENSIDASMYSVINAEYRHQFNEGIYINSITDVAYFENQILDLRQKLYSFGLGLGLTTKAGLFRFIIANGMAENQNFDFSNTKIHVSVSSRF